MSNGLLDGDGKPPSRGQWQTKDEYADDVAEKPYCRWIRGMLSACASIQPLTDQLVPIPFGLQSSTNDVQI